MSTSQWDFDLTHSSINFHVRHLMVSKVHGRFTAWSGALELDDEDLTRSRIDVTIDAASIDTKEDKRDAHLRSPRRDGIHGVADISLLDAALVVEGPISDDIAVEVAARRSYIDVLLALQPPSDNALVAAPVYWDYPALACYRAGPRDELYLQILLPTLFLFVLETLLSHTLLRRLP
jgi:hypothetical protein